MHENSKWLINKDFVGLCKTQYLGSHFYGGEIICNGNYSNNTETDKTTVIFKKPSLHDIITPSFNIEKIISNVDIMMYWDDNLSKIVLVIPQECEATCDNIKLNYVYNGRQVALQNDGTLTITNDFKNEQRYSGSSTCSIIHNGDTVVGKDFEDLSYSSKYNTGTLSVYGNYTNNSKLINTKLIHFGTFEMGDVNKDSYINESDVSAILKHITQANPITDEISLYNADLNHDNTINLIDSILLNTIIITESE